MVTNVVKRAIRRRFGWLPLYELRNRVLLAYTVPGILRFENGQAVERWGLADNLAMLQQLGLMG